MPLWLRSKFGCWGKALSASPYELNEPQFTIDRDSLSLTRRNKITTADATKASPNIMATLKSSRIVSYSIRVVYKRTFRTESSVYDTVPDPEERAFIKYPAGTNATT